VSLADDSTKEIKGTECIDLRMTLRKVLTFQDVLYVSTLQRNLISESLLLRAGYKIVKESNKFIIFKSNTYIGKGFVCDGLFRVNVVNPFDNEIFIPVALNIESYDIWYERLGHVKFNFIKKIINLNRIPKSSFDSSSKCEICVQVTLSQEIMNPSALLTLMYVTRTEFSLEAVEDIL